MTVNEMLGVIHSARGLSLDSPWGIKFEMPRKDMEADGPYRDRLKARARELYMGDGSPLALGREVPEPGRTGVTSPGFLRDPSGAVWIPTRILWSEVPPKAMAEVARVLTVGFPKHGPAADRKVEARADLDAALDHVSEWRQGQRKDPDSGLHPLAHAAARILLLLEAEIKAASDGGKK
jgi:hypothetical protein